MKLMHLVSCLALLGLASAAEAMPAHPSVLEAVAALGNPVTYSETKIPLGELVQKVAVDTGVPLSAARDVVDEPVAVVAKDLPARRLLEQLADLLDYQWTRQGHEGAGSYEIYQDLAARQREAALRQAQLTAAEQRLRDQIAAYFDIASLPEDQYQRLLDEAAKHGEALRKLSPDARAALMASPEERARSRRYTIARNLWTATNRALMHMLRHLTPAQWQTLHEEGWITFSSDPRPGELRLPVEMEKTFRGSPANQFRPDQAGIYNDPQSGERLRQQDQQFSGTWAAANGYRVTVRLETDQYQSKGALFLTADANPLRTGTPNPNPPFFGMGTRVFLYAGPEDQSQEQTTEAEQSPERAPRLANDPVVGVPKRLEITVKPRPKPYGAGTEPLRFRDLLPDLARNYGVQIVSDAYWASSPRVDEPLASGEVVSLAALLDRLAGRTYTWDHEGKMIRLRSRTWFFDRPREVPLRLVRRWKEIAEKQRLLPLEEYVRMATELTDPQIETLQDVEAQAGFPFGSLGAIDVQFARHALRLYASLTPAQRQALWRGEPVPVGAMSRPQQALFLAGLKERARRTDPPIPLDLARWTEGRFALAPVPLIRTILNQGGMSYFQPAPMSDARPAGPGAARLAGVPISPDFGTPVKEPPMRVDRVRFDFEYGPGERQSVALLVAPPDKTVDHTAPSAEPARSGVRPTSRSDGS